MATEILVGIDVGTSLCKAATVDRNGREITARHRPTPWQHRDTGADIDAIELADLAIATAAEALTDTTARLGEEVAVRGLGVTSMAETGVLLDEHGDAVAPGIAWYDNRGGTQAEEIRRDLGADAFAARTGLPVSRMCSLAKLAWLRDHGTSLRRGLRWRNVAELVVDRLGGDGRAELSLASRTGLLDVDAATWWDDALSWLGADADLMPPLVPAGTPMGRVDAHRLSHAAGAVLTVGGHDHPCGQVGVGAVRPGDLLNSCGTAEAFVRGLGPEQAQQITAEAVAAGLTCGWHAIPGNRALLGSLRTGSGLARLRAMLGVEPDDTAALDNAALATPPGAHGMVVGDLGADRMTVAGIGHRPSPGQVWRAAIEAGARQAAEYKGLIEQLAGPTVRLVATGGWIRSRAVADIKRAHLGDFVVPDVTEAGTRGAAIMAGFAAGALESLEHFPVPNGLDTGQ